MSDVWGLLFDISVSTDGTQHKLSARIVPIDHIHTPEARKLGHEIAYFWLPIEQASDELMGKLYIAFKEFVTAAMNDIEQEQLKQRKVN